MARRSSDRAALPVDFAEVKAQENVKRALEVPPPAGNILLISPPGAASPCFAKRLPTILPAMNRAEMIETTQVYSVLGLDAG
ncbi:MAG: ATP-binding protein [Oscillospiraceae bacterium]